MHVEQDIYYNPDLILNHKNNCNQVILENIIHYILGNSIDK